MLFQHGCSLNVQDMSGWTALWHAVSSYSEDAVKLLISARADVNIPNEDGGTLMQEAMDNEMDEIVAILKSAK